MRVSVCQNPVRSVCGGISAEETFDIPADACVNGGFIDILSQNCMGAAAAFQEILTPQYASTAKK